MSRVGRCERRKDGDALGEEGEAEERHCCHYIVGYSGWVSIVVEMALSGLHVLHPEFTNDVMYFWL